MISQIFQSSLAGSVNAPQNTSTPGFSASAFVFLPTGSTFSAQTSLSQHSVILLGTDDPIFNASAYLIRYITETPGVGQGITWIGDVPGGGSVSNIANGSAVQFGMGIGALSAFIQARAVGTIFLDGTTSAPQTTPARKLGSFAVYDATSGDVLHHLTVEAMPGAPETLQSPAEIEQGAIDVAARTSQRDPASLRVLALGTRTLNPQSSFRIDPTTLALEEHAPPTR